MDGADIVDAGMTRLETAALDLLEPGLARAVAADEFAQERDEAATR
jgi:hypothetical protein